MPFYEICDEGYFRNSVIVTAANNIVRPSFPGLFASVTSVASNLSRIRFGSTTTPIRPPSSSRPASMWSLAWRGGARLVGTGNSYAAPHIAGIVALIRSKHPELRPFQTKTVLWATAANVQEAPKFAGRLSRTMHRVTSARASAALSAVGRGTAVPRAT